MKPIKCGCGGEAHHNSASCWNPEEEEWMPKVWHRVICKNCGTQTKAFYTEADAITAWNKTMGERTAKVETVEKPNVYKCAECGQYFHSTAWGSPVEYCSRCGAKLDWGRNG